MSRSGLPCLIALVLLLPGMIQASLPDGAQPRRSINVSLYGFPGAGLSLDANLWRSFGFGTSFTGGRPGLYPGQPGEDPDGDNFVFEVYGNLTVLRSAGPRGPGSYGVSLIGGIWIAQGVQHPLAGLCCAYRADERFIVRGNAVYGPSSGIELGYILTRNIEATVTVLSGRGIFGLRLGLVEPHPSTPDLEELADGR
jgi:hypothetical protein